MDAALQGEQLRLSRAEADLVSAAHGRARLRREAARERASRIRRLALARLLGAPRRRDRLQARGVPPGADRALPLPAVRPPRPRAACRSAAAKLSAMEREYDPLPIRELGAGAGFRRPTQAPAGRVSAGSPARE